MGFFSRDGQQESGRNNSVAGNVSAGRAAASMPAVPAQLMSEEEEPLQGKFETEQPAREHDALQSKSAPVQRMEEEEPLQGKFETAQRAEEEEPLQGKFTDIGKKDEPGEGSGGLPAQLKAGVESLSGMDLSDVKVHYNSPKPAQLKAYAFAQGNDIHMGAGQEKHLPHEAWHVVQQRQGRVQPTMQMKAGIPINDDAGLENEADVMGAKADEAGKTLQQKRAQPLTAYKPGGIAQMKVIQRLGEPTEAQLEGEKDEGASKLELLNNSAGAAGDFMGSAPLTYTNSSNTKIDDDGQRVVDSDKTVVDGHQSDPLGKSVSAMAANVSVGTTFLSAYMAFQKINDADLNTKIDARFSLASSLSGMVKSSADVVKAQSAEKSQAAETAGTTSAVAGTVTDGLDAVKGLVLTIKGIYDAYQDATSDIGSSSREKLETGMATVRGLVESAGKAVSAGKAIADMLQAGSAGLATAIPGLGIALSSIDIAIGIYNLIKAKTSESFIKEQLKKNMWETGQSTFKNSKEGRKQRAAYVAAFESQIEILKVKKAEKEAALAIHAAKPKPLIKADQEKFDKAKQEFDDVDSALALAEKQHAALLENNALSTLKGVNVDRKYNAGFEIVANMVKLVGDVMSLVPEPGSQIAGMSLKVIAGGSKAVKGIGAKIIQWGRDKAAGKPDSVMNKLFDSTKSGDAVKERHKGTIKYIYLLARTLPEPSDNPVFTAKKSQLDQMIGAAGCDAMAFYRATAEDDGSVEKGVKLLYSSLAK